MENKFTSKSEKALDFLFYFGICTGLYGWVVYELGLPVRTFSANYCATFTIFTSMAIIWHFDWVTWPDRFLHIFSLKLQFFY